MKLLELAVWIFALFAFTITVNASNLPRPKKPVIAVESETSAYDKEILSHLVK